MKYTHVFFDADDTLFSFNKVAGLKRLFHNYGIDFSKDDFLLYEQYNQRLWGQYQRHEIDAQILQINRFEQWSARLNVPAMQLNNEFLDAMAEICEPLPSVKTMLIALSGKARLAIITNGFARMQHKRIAHTGLEACFEQVVVSEEVGLAKPHPSIFEHTIKLMDSPPFSKILMVGDNLSTDILGANNIGIDSCYYHPVSDTNNASTTPKNQTIKPSNRPTYQISDMSELSAIVFDKE